MTEALPSPAPSPRENKSERNVARRTMRKGVAVESNQTQLAVSVPQTIIKDIVQAEIVRQLGANGTELIARIVEQALGEECKCDAHRWNTGKTSKVACEVYKEIQTVAKAACKEWVLREQAKITKAVEVALKQYSMKRFAETMVKAMVQDGDWRLNIGVDVKLAKESE